MTDIRNYPVYDPKRPHCREEARYVSTDGKDGGGHTSCLWELDEHGICPNADAHHRAWIDFGLADRSRTADDWAASVCEARRNDAHWVDDHGQWVYHVYPVFMVRGMESMLTPATQTVGEVFGEMLADAITGTNRKVPTPVELYVAGAVSALEHSGSETARFIRDVADMLISDPEDVRHFVFMTAGSTYGPTQKFAKGLLEIIDENA